MILINGSREQTNSIIQSLLFAVRALSANNTIKNEANRDNK
jgi:hypothetical protein